MLTLWLGPINLLTITERGKAAATAAGRRNLELKNLKIEENDIALVRYTFSNKFKRTLRKNQEKWLLRGGGGSGGVEPLVSLTIKGPFYFTIFFKDNLQKTNSVFWSYRKGGWGLSPLGPDRKQTWKIWPILSIEIQFSETQNTFYLILRSLKNEFFVHFEPLPYFYLAFFNRASAGRKEKVEILVVGWKLLCSCVKSVSEQIKS